MEKRKRILICHVKAAQISNRFLPSLETSLPKYIPAGSGSENTCSLARSVSMDAFSPAQPSLL